MKNLKVLSQEELMFKITIPKGNENFSLEGIANVTKKFPSTLKPFAVKETSHNIKIYCVASNHSDYMSLEERINLEVEMI